MHAMRSGLPRPGEQQLVLKVCMHVRISPPPVTVMLKGMVTVPFPTAEFALAESAYALPLPKLKNANKQSARVL